jgi:hypothetical protein
MEPVFTLPWPEFHLAERLQAKFPKSDGNVSGMFAPDVFVRSLVRSSVQSRYQRLELKRWSGVG